MPSVDVESDDEYCRSMDNIYTKKLTTLILALVAGILMLLLLEIGRLQERREITKEAIEAGVLTLVDGDRMWLKPEVQVEERVIVTEKVRVVEVPVMVPDEVLTQLIERLKPKEVTEKVEVLPAEKPEKPAKKISERLKFWTWFQKK